jgi:Glycosyltransferase
MMNLLVDEESAITALVAEKHLEDHFSFLPFTADTGEIYNALDIVTFPNQGIGLGRPVLEAAMYGKPVVAPVDRRRRRAAAERDGAPAAGREPA